jgi:hypothetical protein
VRRYVHAHVDGADNAPEYSRRWLYRQFRASAVFKVAEEWDAGRACSNRAGFSSGSGPCNTAAIEVMDLV